MAIAPSLLRRRPGSRLHSLKLREIFQNVVVRVIKANEVKIADEGHH